MIRNLFGLLVNFYCVQAKTPLTIDVEINPDEINKWAHTRLK